MRITLLALLSIVMIGVGSTFAGDDTKKEDKTVPAVLNFKMKSLTGEDVDLAKYKGKVIMMVNTASKCGYTPQYKDLQALYAKYQDKGFVVLGFPADDFGNQEPGTDEEIGAFCKKNFGVTFPMFSKVTVLGDGKVDLYKYLTDEHNTPADAGEVKWNFEKFLIGKDGRIVARYRSKVKPMSGEVVKAVETELAK